MCVLLKKTNITDQKELCSQSPLQILVFYQNFCLMSFFIRLMADVSVTDFFNGLCLNTDFQLIQHVL